MNYGAKYSNVLITGAGFLATNLRNHIIRNSPETNITGFALHSGNDIRNFSEVCAAVAKCDLVIHTAALTDVQGGIHGGLERRLEFVATNHIGTCNVLEACRKSRVKLLHISTCEVFGKNRSPGVPQDEEHPLAPESGSYAISKAAADHECRVAHALHQQEVVVIRPFTLYGYGQSPRKLIPTLLRQAIGGQPLSILGDGSQKRDFIFADDVAEAIWISRDLPAGSVVNCGTGTCHSIVELAEIIVKLAQRHLNYAPAISYAAARALDATESRGTHRRLKQACNWEPRFTLEAGLELLLRQLMSASAGSTTINSCTNVNQEQRLSRFG